MRSPEVIVLEACLLHLGIWGCERDFRCGTADRLGSAAKLPSSISICFNFRSFGDDEAGDDIRWSSPS